MLPPVACGGVGNVAHLKVKRDLLKELEEEHSDSSVDSLEDTLIDFDRPLLKEQAAAGDSCPEGKGFVSEIFKRNTTVIDEFFKKYENDPNARLSSASAMPHHAEEYEVQPHTSAEHDNKDVGGTSADNMEQIDQPKEFVAGSSDGSVAGSYNDYYGGDMDLDMEDCYNDESDCDDD